MARFTRLDTTYEVRAVAAMADLVATELNQRDAEATRNWTVEADEDALQVHLLNAANECLRVAFVRDGGAPKQLNFQADLESLILPMGYRRTIEANVAFSRGPTVMTDAVLRILPRYREALTVHYAAFARRRIRDAMADELRETLRVLFNADETRARADQFTSSPRLFELVNGTPPSIRAASNVVDTGTRYEATISFSATFIQPERAFRALAILLDVEAPIASWPPEQEPPA